MDESVSSYEGMSAPDVNSQSVELGNQPTENQDMSSDQSVETHHDEVNAVEADRDPKGYQKRIERMRRQMQSEYDQKIEAVKAQFSQPNVNNGHQDSQGNNNPQDVDSYINSLVEQKIQQREVQQQNQKLWSNFASSVDAEASKNEDFAEFSQEMGRVCTPAMLEAAAYTRNPKVLFDMKQNDPDLFNEVRNMGPAEQALRVAEYNGIMKSRKPKVISDAPEPIKAPTPKGTAYQKPISEMSMDERIAMKRKSRRSR